jgi:hypothetical protein
MVGRLWWAPEPQPVLFSTSAITHWRLPRDLRYPEPVLVQCARLVDSWGAGPEIIHHNAGRLLGVR